MRYPSLTPLRTSRLLTNVFPGYVHKPIAEDGTFFDTTNLTTDHYPLISTRKKRGVVKTFTAPGGLIEKNVLGYVDDGTFYYNGLATSVTGLSAGEKQLVSMGAYVLIFPDKVYYNTEDASDYGSMEASYTSIGSVSYAPCRADGTTYTVTSSGSQEPDAPSNGDIWIDTGDGGSTLRQYNSSEGCWIEVTEAYTKISFASQGSVPALFGEYDGVEISGAYFDELNGNKILYAVGGAENTTADYIVVTGLTSAAYTDSSGTVRIQRKVPTMDFVCQCKNRLWGCYYGIVGGEIVNEIYCCALGDFKNWQQFRGLSTDSWSGSVGSDGQWTGAINYLGNPTFFKETCIHQVTVSAYGAHSVGEIVCRGVQKGSHKSLIVVNETLYYKSRSDVCAWQGGFPISVSAALGEERYYDAAAGSFGGKYYLNMRGEDNAWNLFVYDIGKGLWIREDSLHVLQFASVGDELYAIDAGNKKLLALNGTVGTVESNFQWMAETGILTYEYPDQKYLSRFVIRLRMSEGATIEVYLQYNDGYWRKNGSVNFEKNYEMVTLPVRPQRCDHLRMRLTGTGDVEILSISRVLELGSSDRR